MTQSPGVVFERLLDITRRLRGSGGCPWDREQTRSSLKPYVIEEAYEVVEAIDGGDVDGLEEELGDLLFQVVFHTQIASERGEFTMAHLIDRLAGKMVRRHPHVFGDASVASPGEALTQWEMIKRREAADAGRRKSVLDGVPRALPSLLRAQRLQDKAARVRFDWPDAPAAWAKVEEETAETARAVEAGDPRDLQEELGDLLFSLVNVARLASIDAEEALHGAVEKFRRRFVEMEDALIVQGTTVSAASQEEMERAWAAVKAKEGRQGRENGDRPPGGGA